METFGTICGTNKKATSYGGAVWESENDWLMSVLLAARGIYEKAGYKLVKAEKHYSFGQDLIGETWELDLSHRFNG